jgi:anaerobic selenocysteine-containing dehydrogenase
MPCVDARLVRRSTNLRSLQVSIEQRPTFCRICEPTCGLVATVEDGIVTKLRPDKEHPLTRGFACPKGIAMTEVQNDPDRVLTPLRRRSDGSGFDEISWAQALSEIGERLRGVRDQHGLGAIGAYLGNPSAFSYSHLVWFKGFVDALGTRHFYSASSQDTSSRFVASKLLYGTPLAIGVPDLLHTDFLLMLGANPVVSHGSMVAGGNVRDELADVVKRGGRIVVVDPRRTETARLFEHVAVRPGADAWLLLSLLHVVFDEGLEDAAAIARQATGENALRQLVASFAPEETSLHSGIAADVVRQLARDLAGAERAAVYGRVGACTGPFGTLVNALLDSLNVVTGNLDRPGGWVFPTAPIDTYGPMIKRGLDTYDSFRTRIGDYPEVLGSVPAGVMAGEIRTPGEGQLRAMIVTCGNPVLSCPDGEDLADALQQLDLLVSIDLYVTETNRHADYVLPATTFLEREDLLLNTLPYQLRPFLQWTDPVVAPRGEARQEWTILRDIAAELDVVPASVKALRRLGRIGRRLKPQLLIDALLRTGPVGDRYGLRRGGWSIKRLRQHPHGVLLGERVETGNLSERITRADGRVDIGSQPILDEAERLRITTAVDEDYPLRLFGRRELRSINSWMHNSEKLQRKNAGPTLLMHPDDAPAGVVEDGAEVEIATRTGSVTARVSLTEDVRPGSVCLPHGWGHGGGSWQRANAIGGPNLNALTAAGPGTLEPLAGMTILNGLAVRVTPVQTPATV